MDYDTFNPQSRVILYRQVVNDAVVGPWHELDFNGERISTTAGLCRWMQSQTDEIWNPMRLECHGFNDKIFDYGPRLQFFVPENPEGCLAIEVTEEVRLEREGPCP